MAEQKKFQFSTDMIFPIVLGLIALAYYVVLIVGYYKFTPGTAAYMNFYRSYNIFNSVGVPNKIIRILSYTIFILSASWVV